MESCVKGEPPVQVLITGPDLKVFRGGIQTFIRNMIETFHNNRKISIDFFPITYGLHDDEPIHKKLFRLITYVAPFLRRTSNSRVVHMNSTFDTRSIIRDISYAMLAVLIMKKQVILQFHGGQPARLWIIRNSLTQWLLSLSFSLIHTIIILSQIQFDQFKACFPRIGQVNIFPNYVSIADQQLPKATTGTPQFLFLSRIVEEKGVKEILYAAKALKLSGKDFHVTFCGSGALSDWLLESIEKMELRDHVSFRGVVSGEAKESILNESSVLLLPTRHDEGFPFVILEAFKYSLPVISSPAGAIVDLVKEGKNGFLIPSTDYFALSEKMAYFCDHPAMIGTMGSNGRKIVEEHYSLGKMLTSFTNLYQSI